MANKREKLNILRQKVAIMQNDLKVLQTKRVRFASPSGLDKPVYKITNSKPRKMFLETSKEINFNCDAALSKENPKASAERSKRKYDTERELSPVLRDIVSNIQSHYYKRKEVVLYKTQTISNQTQRLYQTSFIGRRYAYNDFGNTRGENSRQTKLRTFQRKKTDTIVNPQRQKQIGIKIVNKIEKSPDRMLTENPKSNSKLYFMTDKPVYLQKKAPFIEKNKSSLIFSPSQQQMIAKKEADSLQKRYRSQKKHFQRYNQQFFSSSIKEKS